MTRKDFELIARTIAYFNFAPGTKQADTRNTIAHGLADALVTTNPRFDRARFLQACGVTL